MEDDDDRPVELELTDELEDDLDEELDGSENDRLELDELLQLLLKLLEPDDELDDEDERPVELLLLLLLELELLELELLDDDDELLLLLEDELLELELELEVELDEEDDETVEFAHVGPVQGPTQAHVAFVAVFEQLPPFRHGFA